MQRLSSESPRNEQDKQDERSRRARLTPHARTIAKRKPAGGAPPALDVS
ncbi:hypothetical protein L810_8764 [Burkholderia sp. AU4i]|nr:hypothetical protein L810_8764 [Burkholderia sp. AU4i]MDW9231185.1 hypothetical protein [Burkholderia cepacia]MDW9250553.1 hypothetical protein [Burkholderia cepacia]QOH39825.1 hypothetical protein C7S14_1721 [Burkholderia cepacia]